MGKFRVLLTIWILGGALPALAQDEASQRYKPRAEANLECQLEGKTGKAFSQCIEDKLKVQQPPSSPEESEDKKENKNDSGHEAL